MVKVHSHLASTSSFASKFTTVSARTLALTQRLGTEPILCIFLPLLPFFSKTQTQTLKLSVNGPLPYLHCWWHRCVPGRRAAPRISVWCAASLRPWVKNKYSWKLDSTSMWKNIRQIDWFKECSPLAFGLHGNKWRCSHLTNFCPMGNPNVMCKQHHRTSLNQFSNGTKTVSLTVPVMAQLHCGRQTRVQTWIPIPFL